jgi:hypothetical protein
MTDETKQAANDAMERPALPLFFQAPEPLDPSVFGSAGLKDKATFTFAAATQAIPVVISEFAMVQKHFPITFVPGGDGPVPVALVGLQEDENLFVESDGSWAEDTYIPAYVRRYPFVFGEIPGEDRGYLCVDTKAEVFAATNPARPFFNGTEPTELTNQALEFCRQFNDDLNLTRAFGKELEQRKLLKEVELRYRTPTGQDATAGRVVSVDPEAFDRLSNDDYLDFRTRGMLALIHFQMTSLTNWVRLGTRWEKRHHGSTTANA